MDVISVIVPVYKTEKYLKRCIESILSQTYRRLEVILVDDGSPDNSGRICDSYAKADARVKVIHKKNAGAAAARNTGLDAAAGDYVAFVDSDDYIENHMYYDMMKINEKYNCDMVICDCLKENPLNKIIYTHDIRAGYYNKEEMRKEYFPQLLMTKSVEYPATISNGVILFRRNLIERKGIRYPEGIRFSEDLLFGAMAAYFSESIYYMKEQCYYHYMYNPESVTHSEWVDKWLIVKKLHNKIAAFFLAAEDFDFRPQVDRTLLFFVYLSAGTVILSSLPDKEKLEKVRQILSDPDVEGMFARLKISSLSISKKQMLLTFLYKYKFALKYLIKRSRKG